jgi:hypothetical protein
LPRSRLCRACKDFHDLDEAWPSACVSHFGSRGEDAGFYVQSDTIDAFRSMADGKVYDSKSNYRRDLRARGLVEVGNDRVEQKAVPLPPVRDALRQAYSQWRG